MSAERRDAVLKIVKAHFVSEREKVVGEEPELGGVYTVVASASTFSRACSIASVVTKKLDDSGFQVYSVAVRAGVTLFFRVRLP